LKFRLPWWDLTPRDWKLTALLLVGYVASACVSLLFIRRNGINTALRVLGVTLAIFSVIFMVLLLSQEQLSRYLLITMVGASVLLMLGSISPMSGRPAAMLALCAVLV